MTSQQGQNAITISALVTGGLYAYRYLAEGESGHAAVSKHIAETTARAFGSGPVLPLGQWVPAFGVTFLGLALLGAASPSVGGAAAVLVGTGAVLGNGVAVMRDLNANKPASASATTPPTPPTVTTVSLNHPPASTSKGVVTA